jgi:hypothetical protein
MPAYLAIHLSFFFKQKELELSFLKVEKTNYELTQIEVEDEEVEELLTVEMSFKGNSKFSVLLKFQTEGVLLYITYD